MKPEQQSFIEEMPECRDYRPERTSRRGAVLLAAVTLISSMLAANVAKAAQPNIVLILADDLDQTTSEYWERATNAGKDDPLKKTRALLKDKGVTLSNAFAPTPICCPARSTILTGKYGHNTGVLTNGGDQGGWGAFVRSGSEANTVAVWLKDAGYSTALIGKYLNGIDEAPTYIPPGWSEWYGMVNVFLNEYMGYDYDINENGTVVHYGNADADYSTDVVARKSVDFINRAEANDAQPFFLYVSPVAPHLPLAPARRHANHPYRNASVPARPNYQEADISDKPAWLISTGPVRLAEGAIWNPIDYRNRQGSLYALDDLVESIINTLAAKGELENTYIVFMSDNGYNLGAHRLIHKMAPYEESIRVPMVIRGPGIAAGSTRTQTVLESDLAPTFAQWAGLSVPASVDGRALQPVLAATAPSSWRTDFLMQYVSDGNFANGVGAELPPALVYLAGMDVPGYSALRDGRYKYVVWSRPFILNDVPAYELYDLQNDPYELDNLLTPTRPLRMLLNQSRANSMKSRMNTLKACAGANCR